MHCVLCRDEIRECGYSLIIDGRSATWSTIKSLLHMFQECLPGQIHVAYIISPSHFLEKKRASMRMGKEKEKLEFTTTVVPTIDRLGHHMDMNQVTADLGGLLPYNHKEWMKMRMVCVCMCVCVRACVRERDWVYTIMKPIHVCFLCTIKCPSIQHLRT